MCVCVGVLRSPYLSNRSKNFSENVGNESEDYFKNSDRARFSKKKIPGAPGVKTGDFMQNCIWPITFILFTRDLLQEFFLY